jgi:hypothetical protein
MRKTRSKIGDEKVELLESEELFSENDISDDFNINDATLLMDGLLDEINLKNDISKNQEEKIEIEKKDYSISQKMMIDKLNEISNDLITPEETENKDDGILNHLKDENVNKSTINILDNLEKEFEKVINSYSNENSENPDLGNNGNIFICFVY